MVYAVLSINQILNVGAENYETLGRYGRETFDELEDIDAHGLVIKGVHHAMKVVSSSDWKAGSCIEGNETAFILYNVLFQQYLTNK